MSGLPFDDLQIGQVFKHEIRRTVTEADNVWFSAITHNPAYLHLDEEYYRTQRAAIKAATASRAIGLMAGATESSRSRISASQSNAIAANVAAFIDDGAALQIGLGKVPDALFRLLAGRPNGQRRWRSRRFRARRRSVALSVVALPATSANGEASRIVPSLNGVCSLPRSDIDVVATEHGAADLRGCDVVERAERLIAIAAPQHRSGLQDALRDFVGRL